MLDYQTDIERYTASQSNLSPASGFVHLREPAGLSTPAESGITSADAIHNNVLPSEFRPENEPVCEPKLV